VPACRQIGLLYRIFETLGTPSEELWPDIHQLAHFTGDFPRWKGKDVRTVGREGGGRRAGRLGLVRGERKP
jgi:hypothetical protein